MRLALAHEHDPYFTLSIALVDPLPHPLEAVYDYLLKPPPIRFLLADAPGAGTTITDGLLLKGHPPTLTARVRVCGARP